jgi:tRNA G37 N-methylase TrmD
MKIDIATLFPEYFAPLSLSLLGERTIFEITLQGCTRASMTLLMGVALGWS